MGYKEHQKEDVLDVTFSTLWLFSLKGINLRLEPDLVSSTPVPFGDGCKVVITQSLDAGSKALTGDVFSDEPEGEWLKKYKVGPPFVMVIYTESVSRELIGGYRMEKCNCIYTYDGFPDGKPELKAWEREKLPNIVTSLTLKLSSKNSPAKLDHIYRSVFGMTGSETTIFDLKLRGNRAEISASRGRTLDEINSTLRESSVLCSSLNRDLTRHIFSALNEKDKLKQFLSYFLFIERYTHSQFKTIKFNDIVKSVYYVPDRLDVTAVKFYKSQFESAKNLSQRFHWCSIVLWSHLEDRDLLFFKKVKVIRDKIAHGEEIVESNLPVNEIREFSFRLLGTAVS